MQLLAQNKKGRFNFEILSTYTAGLALKGWQVKSIKARNVSLNESFAYIHKGEAFIKGMHVSPWKTMGEITQQDSLTEVKLLLHKSELEKIAAKLEQKGLTLIPLKLFVERGLVKAEIALAKGKQLHDKRSVIKEREQVREIERDLKGQKFF